MTMRRPSLALICLLALPACSTATAGRPAVKPAPEPTGVVTVAAAGSALKLWDEAVRQAESDGGADFAAAEAGPVMKISQNNSALRKSLGDRVLTSHATMIKPRFAIPAQGATRTPWFMAEFARKGERGWTQVIFAQTPAGWRVVARSDTNLRVPVAARDRRGLATALTPGERAGLLASPRQIAQAHVRLQNTFGQDRRARRPFTADATPRENAAHELNQRNLVRAAWTMKVDARTAELYALRTAAGGALVWYAITLKETFTARTRAGRLNFNDPVAAATSHGRRYTKRAVKSVSAIYLAVVPKNGKARVPSELGAYLSITGS